MPHLNPIRLDDDTTIYIEAADAPQAPVSEAEAESELQPKSFGAFFS
ncbi:MAG: hypothetical protein AAGG51_12420 [Cyanobacteria bacterium P01_G01_bin.54]